MEGTKGVEQRGEEVDWGSCGGEVRGRGRVGMGTSTCQWAAQTPANWPPWWLWQNTTYLPSHFPSFAPKPKMVHSATKQRRPSRALGLSRGAGAAGRRVLRDYRILVLEGEVLILFRLAFPLLKCIKFETIHMFQKGCFRNKKDFRALTKAMHFLVWLQTLLASRSHTSVQVGSWRPRRIVSKSPGSPDTVRREAFIIRVLQGVLGVLPSTQLSAPLLRWVETNS